MYNVETLKAGLINLVGFYPSLPGEEELYHLTASESGLFFQDFHPLITLENLVSIAPDFSEVVFPAYEGATAYSIGEIVSSNSKVWECIQATTGNAPADPSVYWRETSAFNNWLEKKVKAGIIQTIEGWIGEKFTKRTARSLLERETLFTGTGQMDNLQVAGTKIAGHQIQVSRFLGLNTRLHEIGLQFASNGDVTLYLVKNNETAAVKTETISYTGGGGETWHSVNWDLDPNGAYFLCYNQADLPGLPVNHLPDYLSIGVPGSTYWPAFSKFLAISAFEAPGTLPALWDLSGNTYGLNVSHGLNLKFSVTCDYTDLIIEQKDLFKTAVGLQVAINFLREFVHNPNSVVNRNERTMKAEQILYEIDGDPRGREGGLAFRLSEALAGIQFDTSGIDKACLPCRRRGARVRAI
jgi:hypothetical protein